MAARSAYQYLQIRVQLLGRGKTNEIIDLHVNGKNLKTKLKTMHEFLNYLGEQGFKVVTAELETEGVYTHFYTLQREVFTTKSPTEDIFDVLNQAKNGSSIGNPVRDLLEFTMFDNF